MHSEQLLVAVQVACASSTVCASLSSGTRAVEADGARAVAEDDEVSLGFCCFSRMRNIF